jgi:hypothetical protein
LPVGTEALAVICSHLIGRPQGTFSLCTPKFEKFEFLLPNVEKWVIDYKKMSIQDRPDRNTRAPCRTNV